MRVISSSSIHGRLVFLSIVSILVRRRGPQFRHSRIIGSIATICLKQRWCWKIPRNRCATKSQPRCAQGITCGWWESIPLSQTPPPQIQPAPNNPWGWLDDPYSDVWGAQMGYFIAMHATHGDVVPVLSSNPMSPLEDVQVVAVSGLAGLFRHARILMKISKK